MSQFDPAAFQAQVDHLAKIAATSTDMCVISTLIAAQNKHVQDRVAEKAKTYVWKGLYCESRTDGKIAAVFDFECHPGQICLVKPWFAAVADVEFGTVYAIQDPYRPEATPSMSSGVRRSFTDFSGIIITRTDFFLSNVVVDGSYFVGDGYVSVYIRWENGNTTSFNQNVASYRISSALGSTLSVPVNYADANFVCRGNLDLNVVQSGPPLPGINVCGAMDAQWSFGRATGSLGHRTDCYVVRNPV